MKPLSNPDLKSFGLLLAGAIALVFGLLIPWIWGEGYPAIPWLIALGLVVVAFVAPRWLSGLYQAWMKIGHVLGMVNTHIILILVYILVFLPIGLLMKLVRYDPLKRKFDAKQESYRIASERPSKDHFERPF